MNPQLYQMSIEIELIIEYFTPYFLSTIKACDREALTSKQRKDLIDRNKSSFLKTDKTLIIQDKICKYSAKDMFDDLLYSFDKENKYNLDICYIGWEKNIITSKYSKDTNLPKIYINILSTSPIDTEEFKTYILSNSYMLDNKYLQDCNNGWTWYTTDYKCEYARTEMISVNIV